MKYLPYPIVLGLIFATLQVHATLKIVNKSGYTERFDIMVDEVYVFDNADIATGRNFIYEKTCSNCTARVWIKNKDFYNIINENSSVWENAPLDTNCVITIHKESNLTFENC
jgi:hypothetical protein